MRSSPMLSPERQLDRYDPRADLTVRWPGWTVHLTDMHGIDEVIDVPRRVILIDPHADTWSDPLVSAEEWAVAHATAHLDLGHAEAEEGRPFTAQQEADADGLARLRLGVIPDLPEVGDATPAAS